MWPRSKFLIFGIIFFLCCLGLISVSFIIHKLKSTYNPKDCTDVRMSGKSESGVYVIYPDGNNSVLVYCDMTTDEGGWTVVLQRGKRGTHRTDFYRNWTQYEIGFGDVEGGDYNIGLKNLFALTSSHEQVGSAGDSLKYHNGQKFSTLDQDNDLYSGNNCAAVFGAWWDNDCGYSNLNGKYFVERIDSEGVNWYHWKSNWLSMKTAEMKTRRLNFDTLQTSLV
jgi:hypothetical protein